MTQTQLSLYPYFIQYAKDYLGGSAADSVSVYNDKISVQAGSTCSWGPAAIDADQADQVAPSQEMSNPTNQMVDWVYDFDQPWSTEHELEVTIAMIDATAYKNVEVTALVTAPAPVGAFPPPAFIDVGSLHKQSIPQNIPAQRVVTTIQIPPFQTAVSYGAAIFDNYSATFYVKFWYSGVTQFQCVFGDTVKIGPFYGVGTIMRPYLGDLPNVTISDDNNVYGSCYVTFSGNLFKRFQAVTRFSALSPKQN